MRDTGTHSKARETQRPGEAQSNSTPDSDTLRSVSPGSTWCTDQGVLQPGLQSPLQDRLCGVCMHFQVQGSSEGRMLCGCCSGVAADGLLGNCSSIIGIAHPKLQLLG